MTDEGKLRVSKANTGWVERRIDQEIQHYTETLKEVYANKGLGGLLQFLDTKEQHL